MILSPYTSFTPSISLSNYTEDTYINRPNPKIYNNISHNKSFDTNQLHSKKRLSIKYTIQNGIGQLNQVSNIKNRKYRQIQSEQSKQKSNNRKLRLEQQKIEKQRQIYEQSNTVKGKSIKAQSKYFISKVEKQINYKKSNRLAECKQKICQNLQTLNQIFKHRKQIQGCKSRPFLFEKGSKQRNGLPPLSSYRYHSTNIKKQRQSKKKQPELKSFKLTIKQQYVKSQNQIKRDYKMNEFIQSETFKKINFQNQILLQQQLKCIQSQSITILQQNTILYQMNGTLQRQIASLTKIMTCILSIYLSKKYQIDLNLTYIKVTRKLSKIQGTTAELQPGDKISIQQLLYGMMLPSGNDAALTLAQYFGKTLKKQLKQTKTQRIDSQKSTQISQNYINNQSNIEKFVKQMNKFAKYLNLNNTKFSNPHGLPDKKNKSCSNDISYLCYYAMKNELFKQIVKTTNYRCKLYNQNLKINRQLNWINTNKLLGLQNCLGIKTGITNTAGPCMASAFSTVNNQFCPIIVILKTNNIENRFKQVEFLYNWSLEKFLSKQTISKKIYI